MKKNSFEWKMWILEMTIFVLGILIFALCAVVFGPSDSQATKWFVAMWVMIGGLIIFPFVVFSGYIGAKRMSEFRQSSLSSSDIRKHNSLVNVIRRIISLFRR